MKRLLPILAVVVLVVPVRGAGPTFVDITWLSVSNVYYELGSLRILTDGYITRLPKETSFGGGLRSTREPFTPDTAAVSRVLTALGGPSSVNVLLTGHSHFDHAFDTPTWSRLTGAPIIGPRTTLAESDIALVRPAQYLDKWRLDVHGVRALSNTPIKRALGFAVTPTGVR